MQWRRQRKTLHEELLEQGARETRHDPDVANDEPPASGRVLALAMVVLVGSLLVHLGPLWLQALFAVVMLVYFTLTARWRPRPAEPRHFGLLRGLFLVWLAISVSATVLVALGGFYREDVVLLGVVWAILAVLWLLDRLLPRLWSALTSA